MMLGQALQLKLLTYKINAGKSLEKLVVCKVLQLLKSPLRLKIVVNEGYKQ